MRRNCPTDGEEHRPHASSAKVFNQREGTVIRVGDNIQVVVLKACDGFARIAVRAPRNLDIYTTKSDGPSALTPEPSAK